MPFQNGEFDQGSSAISLSAFIHNGIDCAASPPYQQQVPIFIVIVAWNHFEKLQSCLASLRRQTYPNLRIVISDNGSSDETVRWLREAYREVEVLENGANLGFAEGANVGIRYALAERAWAVILLNPDTTLESDTVEHLVRTARQQKLAGAVQAKVYLASDDFPRRYNTIGNEMHYLGFGMCGGLNQVERGDLEDDREIPLGSGAALLLTTEALGRVGLLDGRMFLYHEDFDLSVRLRLAGFQIWLSSRAVVHHDYEFWKGPQKFYYLERNRWLFLLKTYQLRSLILFAPAFFIAECGILWQAMMDGWLGGKLRSYWSVLRLTPHWWSERCRIQRSRQIPDRELFRYVTTNLAVPGKTSRAMAWANRFFRVYWIVVAWIHRVPAQANRCWDDEG